KISFFFFQAEDGIRDRNVTGVQTCALPISLMIRQNRRRGIAGLAPGQKAETDLSWQDWSLPMAISPDGKWIFFAEEGDAGGPRYSAYMRNTNGSPAIRLGDGVPQSVSPDGKWVAAIVPGEPQQLMRLPTRAGDVRNVARPEFNYEVADWLPDGKRLLVSGNEPGIVFAGRRRRSPYSRDPRGNERQAVSGR